MFKIRQLLSNLSRAYRIQEVSLHMDASLPPVLYLVQHDTSFTCYHHNGRLFSMEQYVMYYDQWLDTSKIIKHLE
jgi:hypothetical protein